MSIKVGIVGATGYTGSELVRLLHRHPEAEIDLITSETYQGKKFSDIHPHFHDIVDQMLTSADLLAERRLDVVFLALPHGVSMEYVREHRRTDFRIIDLSGDFRLADAATYEAWYGKTHQFPEGFKEAVYGLPELYREAIREARLVANPGCYPTSAILGCIPPIAKELADLRRIVVDAKSGVTGAGVKAKPTNQYSNVSDNFKAYALKTHRHTVEIEEKLTGLNSKETLVQFTPHLLPVDRGILSTIYLEAAQGVSEAEIQQAYHDFYADEPFVRLRETPPTLKEVRGTNLCDLYLTFDERTGRIIVISVIDNLVKGAAGQAVHNMNLMFGLEETTGLDLVPLHP